MIYSLSGILSYIDSSFVVIECSGIGMKCFASTSTITSLKPVGNEVKLLTYMVVREDAMDLYGFLTQGELDAFKLLISVSGVGPKAAISVLSALPVDRLSVAISCGDINSIQAAQGIGKKTAERIVLELKEKISGVSNIDSGVRQQDIRNAVTSSNTAEAIEVLVSLGFTQSDASVAVSKLDSSLSVDAIIRKALKILSLNL